MYLDRKKTPGRRMYCYWTECVKGKLRRKRMNPVEEWFENIKLFISIDDPPEQKPVRVKRSRRTYMPNGRPPIFSGLTTDIFKLNGFNVYGKDIRADRKSFFSLEACRYRFAFLSDELKAIVKTPENLQLLCRKAFSMLKACNRKQVQTTYDTCFRQVLQEEASATSPGS